MRWQIIHLKRGGHVRSSDTPEEWSVCPHYVWSVLVRHWYLYSVHPPLSLLASSGRSNIKRVQRKLHLRKLPSRNMSAASQVPALALCPYADNHRALKWGETRVTSQVSCVCVFTLQPKALLQYFTPRWCRHTRRMTSEHVTHKHTLHTFVVQSLSSLFHQWETAPKNQIFFFFFNIFLTLWSSLFHLRALN